MPRISRIEPMWVQEQQSLFLRTTTSVKKLNQTMKECFKKITDYLGEVGQLKSDVGFVAYYNFDFKEMEIEVALPVASPIKGRGEISAGKIIGQEMLFCLYQGPYNKIRSTYDEMDQWIDDHGYQRGELVYEHYYNQNEVEKNQLVTKILIPIAKIEN